MKTIRDINLNDLLTPVYITRWLFGCLVFVWIGCRSTPASIQPLIVSKDDSIKNEERIKKAIRNIHNLAPIIRNGDIITRTGNDFTSESLRSILRRDKTYSHCGIAMIENDTLFIYHAMGGEFNPDQKLLRQTFYQFAEPYSNRGIGIYRFDITENQIEGILNTVHDHYYKPLMFDMDFDLSTDEKMYCAEFVVKSLQSGTQQVLEFPVSTIGTFDFYGVDDIFLHPRCRLIRKIVYE